MSSSSPSLSPSISRSPDFWFDDGSIILQVETTQFCVHRGIICANSVVFRDMHELSEPGEQDVALNGCPVVVLHGDTAHDWSNLLQYIYFPAKASKRAEHIPFPLIVSLLRLGRKYQFSDIWALALHTVRIQIPVDNVDSWELFLDDGVLFSKDDDHIPGYWVGEHIIDLLNLAIEHDIQTILPIAYYLCTHIYTLNDILRATIRPADDSIPTVHPDALRTLLLGRQKLQSTFYRTTMSWLTQPDNIPSGDCTGPPTNNPCEAARTWAFEKIVALDLDMVRALNMPDHEWYSGFCDNCVQKIVSTIEDQREKIWSDLPSYFGLPPWGELEDPEC